LPARGLHGGDVTFGKKSDEVAESVGLNRRLPRAAMGVFADGMVRRTRSLQEGAQRQITSRRRS
jgi:hypothetical protein